MKWFGAGCFVKTTGTMGRDLVLHMNSSASEVLLHRLSWLHCDAHTATPPCFMRVVVEKAVLGGAMEKATLIYFIWDLWISYFNMMYICTAIVRLNYRNGFTGIHPNPSCSAISGWIIWYDERMMEHGDVFGWQFDRYPNGDDGS